MRSPAQIYTDKKFVNLWLTKIIWPDSIIICPRCQGTKIDDSAYLTMPIWCTDCRDFFSMKFGTVLQPSRISLFKWVPAVAYDLLHPIGIFPTELSKKIGVSRSAAHAMLRITRNALISNAIPEEFKHSLFFRIEEVPIVVRETSKRKSEKNINQRKRAAQNFVLCITEFKSDKIWVKVVDKKELERIGGILAKIIPKSSYIFTNNRQYYDGIDLINLNVREMGELDELVIARAKSQGLQYDDIPNTAGFLLEQGFSKSNNKISFEGVKLFAKAFEGRWNMQNLDFDERMKIIFNKLLKKIS